MIVGETIIHNPLNVSIETHTESRDYGVMNDMSRQIRENFHFGDKKPERGIDWDFFSVEPRQDYLLVVYRDKGGRLHFYNKSLSSGEVFDLVVDSEMDIEFCRRHLLTPSMEDNLREMLYEHGGK